MGWVVTAGASEEDAAATAVLNEPVASRGGEEGEGEVSGKGGGAGCWRGRVRRDGGVEGLVLFEEAEEGRDVELAKAPEQEAVSGDAAEGDAGGGGADKVGCGGQPEEDLR
jgi:hypothetical protein